MQPSPLADDDVRSMVKLLGDIAGMDDSLETKRRALVEGLARLLDADAWYWAIADKGAPNEQPTFKIYLKQGFGEAQFAHYLRALEHPEIKGIIEPCIAESECYGRHITRLYQQLDLEGNFPRSDDAIGWREANSGPFIFSAGAAASGQTHGICIFRFADRPLFTDRDSKNTHFLLSQVSWLHDSPWTEPPTEQIVRLSPRLQTVLNLLLQGHARKKIADQLGISPHTLGEYIKTIYSRFGVGSQASLISRFASNKATPAPPPQLGDCQIDSRQTSLRGRR